MTPEQAFSHAFIAKAVHELKGMRGQSETQKMGNKQKEGNANSMSETMLPQINFKQ